MYHEKAIKERPLGFPGGVGTAEEAAKEPGVFVRVTG